MDQHTANGTAEQSEVHVVRAVETGVINVSCTWLTTVHLH